MQVPGTKPEFEMPGPPPPKIEPVYIAMAAAQMHAEGRWPENVAFHDSLLRFGRPNVKPGVATKDRLKGITDDITKKRMQGSGVDENLPIARTTEANI